MIKKRTKWLVVIGTPALVCAAIIAYLQGWIIPNYPSDREYPIRGIDISHHQGRIRWNEVPKDVRFVYMKATEGSDWVDPEFLSNWKAAAQSGIRRGAYHYFRFSSSGREQAAHFLRTVPFDANALPPVVDLEFGGNETNPLSVEAFRRELNDFLERIRLAMKTEPIIYTDNHFRDTYLADVPIHRLWYQSFLFRPPSETTWIFNQYSERSHIRGIDGMVDADVFNGSEDDFNRFVTNP